MTLIFSRMCMLHHEIVLQNTSTTHIFWHPPGPFLSQPRFIMRLHYYVLQNTLTPQHTHLLTSTPFCLNPDLSTWCKGIMNTIGRVLIVRFFWLQIASFCPHLTITVKGLLNEYYTYHATFFLSSPWLIERSHAFSHFQIAYWRFSYS